MSQYIKLTDGLAVSSDAHQWILCKATAATKKSPAGWRPFKYYGSLDQLVQSASGYLLRTSEYDSFEQLSLNAERVGSELRKAIEAVPNNLKETST
jgi:hypothetical protein